MFRLYKFFLSFFLLLFFLLPVQSGYASTVEYELTIAKKDVNLTGEIVQAMTLNGSIPGPVLWFKEGDFARIHVRNDMDVDTSIHWHGLLVPPGMDGVPNISFPPIAPGKTFIYEFPIRQSGTYWYHSHTGLQEQRGVYGPIVIEPSLKNHTIDREYVVLFSDWTDEDPLQVLRTLKRGSEWFAIEKGSAQSIFGAARLGMLGDYFKRELQRMPPMDIADIAYDAFLANGKSELHLVAMPGETIRLRFIDGSATTYFHLEFAGGPMKIVSADGIDVMPVELQRMLVGVAETYDVLLRIPLQKGAYEFRATSHDGSGFTSVWLGTGPPHKASDVAKPNLYHSMGDFNLRSLFSFDPASSMGMGNKLIESGHFDAPGMMAMENMEHDMNENDGMQMHDSQKMGPRTNSSHSHQSDKDTMQPMLHENITKSMKMPQTPSSQHSMEDMKVKPEEMMANSGKRSSRGYGSNFKPMASDVSSHKNLVIDGMDNNRPWPPYKQLKAVNSTVFPGNKPLREIRLTLDGDMERYVWFLNNKALSETDHILIRQGEIVRFTLINRTMMHHPMHLHGHFFRVINGQGDNAPLKHTVDVAPMSTTVIEFDANVVGDWFFHCHLLYHMKTGMARMLHYENFIVPDTIAAIRPQLYKESWYIWGEAEILSNMTKGFLNVANTRHTLSAEWESGWQKIEDTKWEGLLTWDYYSNRFVTVFTGLYMQGEGSEKEHGLGVLGITYLLPLNIESRYWLDTDGEGRFSFEKEFTLTPRLSLSGEAEYDTNNSQWESQSSLTYIISKSFSVIGKYHSDFGWGMGAMIQL